VPSTLRRPEIAHIERMASFAVNTGVRAENVCNLKWDWEQQLPELSRSVFIIPASEFKTGRSHMVILNDAAQAVIQSMREKHAIYVFPFRGDRIWEMRNNGWKQARERARLPKVRVHDLRHTFGMRLRYAGVSEEDRALLLGHATKTCRSTMQWPLWSAWWNRRTRCGDPGAR
jgi:integrase